MAGNNLRLVYYPKLLCDLGAVSVLSVIHINYYIGLFSHGFGEIKKSFMWENVFMVAVFSQNKLIFVSFYPNILEK